MFIPDWSSRLSAGRRHLRGFDAWTLLLATALFCWGFLVNLHFSRLGLQPLDQSIAFDGGWRILNGQVPFRDFFAPNGITLGILQAPFFLLFGVNWLALCAHASLFNGVFCILGFGLLRWFGLARLPAALYAACSAFFFYPPVGTPFMEQHAFFFCLLAILLALAANRATSPRLHGAALLAIPGVLVAGFFSKQIPTLLVAPVLVCLLLVPGRARYGLKLSLVGAGGGLAIALPLLYASAAGCDLDAAVELLFRLPSQLGQQRMGTPSQFLHRFIEELHQRPRDMGLLSFRAFRWGASGVLALFAALGTIEAARWFRSRHLDPVEWRPLASGLGALLLGVSLLGMCAFVASVANNQSEFAMPYLPVALGLVNAALGSCLRPLQGRVRATRWRWPTRGLLLAGSLPLLAVALRDTSVMLDADAARVVHDMRFDSAAAERNSRVLPPPLAIIRWDTHPGGIAPPAPFVALVERLASRDAPNFLLLGNATLLYGITGRPSVSPFLWVHPGLTVPPAGSALGRKLDRLLLERLRQFDVRLVLLEDEHSRMHFSVKQIPETWAYIERSRCPGDTERVSGSPVHFMDLIRLCP